MKGRGFNPYPQCMQCLIGLARSAAAHAGGSVCAMEGEAETLARRILWDAERKGLTSPEVANDILRELRALSGVSDPYLQFKEEEMATARLLLDRMRWGPQGGLRPLLDLAVLGNSLDFFKDPQDALGEVSEVMGRGLSFFRDDSAHLEAFLAGGPGLILYLTDNAGEIYFDLPLYRHLLSKAERTVLVVKGGPALNDLTRLELKAAGLEREFPEIADTGTDGAGVDWRRVSGDFQDLVDNAALILSKGMANFETLHERDLPCPVFFLFKAKCLPIQEYLGAPPESFVALWHNPARGLAGGRRSGSSGRVFHVHETSDLCG